MQSEEIKKFVEALKKTPNSTITFDRELLIYLLELMNQ